MRTNLATPHLVTRASRVNETIPTQSGSVTSRLEDSTGHIVLSRPELRNALSCQMWQAIPQELASLVKAGARVICISGTDGAFVAGADLSELKQIKTYKDAQKNWAAIFSAFDAVANCPVPTIAAIDGPCIGGGCLLSASCDLRYATSRSVFGIPVARLAIVLDDLTINRVANVVGRPKALEMIMRGNTFDAAEALRCGLVNAVVEQAELAGKVAGVCSEITANSSKSIQAARNALRNFASHANKSTHDDAIKSYLSPEFAQRIQA